MVPFSPNHMIAPPSICALLLLNVELLKTPFLPCHRIAPPYLSSDLSPFAFALVNVMLLMITLSAEIWKIRAVFEPCMVMPLPFMVILFLITIPCTNASSPSLYL